MDMYINHSTLEICYSTQKVLETNYIKEDSLNRNIIIEQTYDMLTNIHNGVSSVQEKDIPLVEGLLDSYLSIVNWRQRRKALKLAAKLKALLAQQRQTYQKLSDANYVAYILNNKKSAAQLTQEELLKSYSTLNASKQFSPKLKSRLQQKLQSYAVLKYHSLPPQNLETDDVTKDFIKTFNLAHVKHNFLQASLSSGTKQYSASDIHAPINSVQKLQNWMTDAKYWGISTAKKINKSYKRIHHRVKSFFLKNEYKIAALTFGLLGFGTYQANRMLDKADYSTQYKLFVAPTLKNSAHAKTASFTQEYAKLQQSKKQSGITNNETHKTLVGEDYYDTSLLIHLKSKSAVESLYGKIDSLHQAGKIKMSEGMDTKRYAHSFTMYKLIRPNSKENKAIENLLSGGAEDASYIDALVKQAGAKGSGVKADDNSVTSSNFSKASLDLQQKHLQNLRSFSRF